MKYIVATTLIGLNSCMEVEYTTHKMEVKTQEECINTSKEYSKLPFVKGSTCTIVSEKE